MLAWAVHLGHAVDILRTMPDGCANCVLTSPPYWGLRDYGHDGQIGLELSPDEYVESLRTVFGEVRRVLTNDGVAWCNLGDSYASSTNNTKAGLAAAKERHDGKKRNADQWATVRGDMAVVKSKRPVNPIGHKQLLGMPWRVAFALQADGWYLRSDVIWAKPNPMPESVTDRPTKAHEYVFLLTKRERYAYNADAIREPITQAMLDQIRQGYDGEGTKDYESSGVQNPSSVKARIIAKHRRATLVHNADSSLQLSGRGDVYHDSMRANARSVWTIPTEPSALEHFAVMPRALARKCILAGCPYGGTVIDPFCGTGTSGVVALEEGRNFVGIELNPKYHAIARERLGNVAPLLASERSA